MIFFQEPPEPWTAHVEPASEEAERSLETFELAAGFRVELFAAEPRLANPVCLYVDNAGDVWVAETFRHFEGVTDMREHEDWLDEDLANRTVGDRLAMLQKHEGENFAAYGRATDQVRWLSDTDGDGRADVDTVFAEGFTAHEAGIGAGLLVHGGDVYYTCIPDLWRLRDEDGNRRADGRPEEREVLSTGYGVNIALLGHDLHGLRIGPDGKLYFSCGDRGFHVETEHGVLAHPHTGAVLRCDLDGSNLEVFATGLRNPQELVFDELGNLWTGDNNSDGGDEARWVHVVEGSDSGWRYSYQWLTEPDLRGPWNDEKLWRPRHAGQAAYILPPVANLASGPSGLTYDRGTGLPEEFARHFFLCDFRGDPAYSGIHAFTVVPKGAGWELGPVKKLLWNGLPTDVDFGPDGSLYVSDWVNGWDKTGKGRIYRVFAPEALAPDTARLLRMGAGEWEPAELFSLLQHADQRLRQMAQLELVRRGDGRFLEAAAMREGDRVLSRLTRLHALWGLGMLGEDVSRFAADPDPEVRAQVCRILGDADEQLPRQARVLVAGLHDTSERVRMHAAIALGKWPADPDLDPVSPLIDLLRRGGADPVLRHAAVTGLVGQAAPEQLVELAADPSREVRLGAVVALRRLEHTGVASFLGDADPLVVLEAARAIHDVPLAGGTRALAALIGRDTVERGPLERALGRRVVAANHHLHDETAARALLDFVAREGEGAGLRAEALAHLTEWSEPTGRDPVTGAWRPVEAAETGYLGGLVAAGFDAERVAAAPDEVQLAWIDLLGRYPAPAGEAWFEALVTAQEGSAAVRVRALDALADSGSLRRLTGVLEQALFDPADEVRAAALERIGEIDAEQAFPLIEAAATRGELAERRVAYGLLAGSTHAGSESLLAEQLAGLRGGEVPVEVALELVQASTERGGERLEELLSRRAEGRDDPALAPFLDGLYGGDTERGRALFTERADLQCLRCHATGADEANGDRPAIGPTLAELGTRSTRAETLTSIVDPNRALAGEFRGTLFFMEDGTRLEGQVLEEGEASIRVLDAEGEVHTLDPAAIEASRMGLSAMPEGLGALITPAEMRDLLEFLSNL